MVIYKYLIERGVIALVKVIMGVKGSGKTKQLIDLVKVALAEEKGDVVCIEKTSVLTYDIPYTARLVIASQYNINNYEILKGFISGLHAGNYDITSIFIDNLLKIINESYDEKTDAFIKWCNEFSEREKVDFTLTVSADVALASDEIKKYF